ncbi:MAG: CpaD family pilus assembly lipoprotein [Rhodospirillales bacterium]
MITIRSHFLKVCALAVAAVTACSAPDPETLFYKDAHPIVVVEEIVNIGLSVPDANGGIAPPESPGWARFVRVFHLRAKTPVTLHVDETMSDGLDRQVIVERTRTALKIAGISGGLVKVMPGSLGHEGVAPVLLTFDAHQVDAPECGDWSDKGSYNWSNTPPPNFGCSFQRNLALTVANPGDFIDSQPMSAFGAVRGIVNVLTVQSGAASGGGSETYSE